MRKFRRIAISSKVKEIAKSVIEAKLPYRSDFCDRIYCIVKDYIDNNYDLRYEDEEGKEYKIFVKCTKRSISLETRTEKIYSNSSLKDECSGKVDALVDKYINEAIREYFDTPGVRKLVKEMENGNITMKQLQGDLSDLAIKAADYVKEKVEEDLGKFFAKQIISEARSEGIEKSSSIEKSAEVITAPQDKVKLEIDVVEDDNGNRTVNSVSLIVGDQRVDIRQCIAQAGKDTWNAIWKAISEQ